MALVGNIIAEAFAGNPSLINYDMFVAVFSMLSLFYLFAATWNESFSIHPILPVALDLLNTLFFFCAAVAMAAELGAHSWQQQRKHIKLTAHSTPSNKTRPTPSATTLPTDPTIEQDAAEKLKHQQHSSGSALRATQQACSSPSSALAVVAST